jgi:hypothetical protein
MILGSRTIQGEERKKKWLPISNSMHRITIPGLKDPLGSVWKKSLVSQEL